MNIGAICSAGGATFFSAMEMSIRHSLLKKSNVKVLADRPCSALLKSKELGFETELIHFKSQKDFSRKALSYFEGCDFVLLYYTRLIDNSLLNSIPTINFHPSLLPAFSGFNAIKQAKETGVKFIGSTSHLATEEADQGPIIGQVCTPIEPDYSLESLNKISYMQKTYLTISCIELIVTKKITLDCSQKKIIWETTPPFNFSANPALFSASLSESFAEFQQENNFRILP